MPGRIYTDILTVDGVNFYAVLVDPNGLLSAPIGSYATLKTAPMIWVNTDGATTWDLVYPTVAPPGGGSAVFLWGNGSVGTSATDRFLTPGYQDALAPVVTSIVQFRTLSAGTLMNLRVRHNQPDGNGNDIVYTVRVNGVPTAIQVTLASNANDGSDLVNSQIVAAGVLVDIIVTKAAGIVASPAGVVAELGLS